MCEESVVPLKFKLYKGAGFSKILRGILQKCEVL